MPSQTVRFCPDQCLILTCASQTCIQPKTEEHSETKEDIFIFNSVTCTCNVLFILHPVALFKFLLLIWTQGHFYF